MKKGLPALIRDGKVIELNGKIPSPFKVGKEALKGAGKAPARANSADAADTGEYTFGYEQKEVQEDVRYTYFFLQNLTCTYPEDAYTNVQYSYSSSSENIYLVQDVNDDLGYGAGRIYICNRNHEAGTITITAELQNGEEVVASDSYTVNFIIAFAFSETSATATIGKPFTAPTLTNRYDQPSVTYTSSNTDVATVDKDGVVTPVTPGETTITATLDADNSITASYTLTVENPVVSLPYEKSFADGIDDFTIVNIQLEEGLSEAWTYDSENQCVTASGFIGGSNRYVWSRLVSPFIDTASDKTGVLLSFDQAVDNGFDNIKYRAALYVREEGGDWKMFDIEHPSVPDGGTFSEFTNQTVNLSEFAGKRIQIAFEYISNENAAGTWRIKNLSVVAADVEAPKVFAFSESYVTVNIGEEYPLPTLRNDYGGTVVYISDNEGVATVDENGVVTIVGSGQTNIYAIQEEAGLEAYYTLTVIDPSLGGLPYEESFYNDKGRFTIDDVALGEGLSEVWTHDSGNQCMKASATVDGAGKAAESWLISPVIEELQDAEQKYTISFEQAVDNRFGNVDGETTLWVREEGGEWEVLTIGHPTAPEDGTLSEFEAQTVNVLKFVGKKIQIGFKYMSSAEAAGTWRIRNVSVNGVQRTFAFSATEAAATIGEEFTPPTLINEYEGYEVRYRSRSTIIAKVDEMTGEVTPVKKGSTYIYATLYDGDNNVREVSYRLTVSGDVVVTLPYVENFDANIGLFDIEIQKTAGGRLSYVWSYNKSNQVMRAAPTTTGGDPDVVMESWLVSPIVNAETDESTLYLSFDHAVNKDFGDIANEATLWVREVDGEWSRLEIDYPAVKVGFITQVADLSAYIGKKIQIGFKYMGSVNTGGQWDIKNVQVSTDYREASKVFAFPTDYVEATIGEEFNAPKLTNTYEGTVHYISDNNDVATVDENTGVVTLVGPGETNIVAFLEEEGLDAHYILNVIDPSSVGLPYNEDFMWDAGRFSIENTSLGEGLTDVWTHDDDNQSMKATAKVDGNSVASESWLISPVIAGSTYNGLSLSFDQAVDNGFGNIADEALLLVREEDGEWEPMAITYPSAEAGFETQTVNLFNYAGRRIQIAFLYNSSAEAAGTWSIRNVSVRAFTKRFEFSEGNAEATIGEEFTAPTLINDYEGEGPVSYDSGDTDVATVDETTGVVTLVGPGQTYIQATRQGDGWTETRYTLTVYDPSSVGVPYEEGFAEGTGRFTIDNMTLGEGLTDVWTHDADNWCMKATAKVDGNSVASESWLVSPVITKVSGDRKITLTFEQAVDNGFGDIDTEATLWAREEGGEWQQIAIAHPAAPAEGTISEFEGQMVNLSAYAGKRFQFAFKYTSSAEAAGTWRVRNIWVEKADKVFAFSESNVEATIGEDFTAPTLINDYEGGTISYSVSDTDVATVDENTGVVTFVGPGQTYITATQRGDDWHYTSYSLTVYDPSSVGLPYEEGFAEGAGRFTIDNMTLGAGLTDVWTHDADNWCMKATAKVDGVSMASESWLVSPVVTKISGDRKITLTFEQAVDNGFGDMETEATLWAREEGGEWQQIAIAHPAAPAEGTISEFEGQMVNLSAYAGKRFQFAFKYTSSAEAAGTWRVRNIWVEKADKVFAFSESNVEATIGEDFTAPTLINDYEGEGTVVYSSNDENVAMIDYNTGVVTLVGQGTTQLWANIVKEGEIVRSAYYTITVTDPYSVQLPYDENFAEGTGRFTIDNVTLSEGLTDVWTHDGDNQCMKATAKVDGVSVASESWLVSPVIAGSTYNSLSLSFDQAIDGGFGSMDAEATLWVREADGEWQQMIIGYPSAEAGSETQTVDLSKYAGRRIQIGFRYTSSAEAAGTWSIKNVSVNAFHKEKRFAFSTDVVTATIGEEFTAPKLINDYEGTVRYHSSNTDVATVDENTGEVTLVSQGQVYITAALQGDERRTAGYKLTVVGPSSASLPYYENFAEGTGRFFIDDVALGEGLTDVWTHDADNQCMKATGKADGNNKASESWFVSPFIYMGYYNGFDKTYLTFEQAVDNGFGDIAGEVTLWIREIGGEWQNVAIAYPEAPADGSLSGFGAQVINLTAYLDAGTEHTIQFAFKYTSSASSAGTWSIRNVSVETVPLTFAFSSEEVTAFMGDEFTAPTLTNEYGGTVTYSSSDESVATVDATTGEVTIVGLGWTDICAELEGEIFKRACYLLSVEAKEKIFAFSSEEAAATIGEKFTPPTLINEYEGYEVRYRSRSTSVATVNETTGEVTLVGRGTATIYAELYDGDNLYRSTYYTLTVSGYPVVTLPYVENFDASRGQFTIENVKLAGGSAVWSYNRQNHVMSAAPYKYNGGSSDVVMESWLVSPVINAETDETALYLSFDHAINKAFGDIATEATLWVREAGGEWSRLEIGYPSVEAGFITQVADLSAYIGKKIQIGFKYMGSVDTGGQWDIKNVQVSQNVPNVFAFSTNYAEAVIGEEFKAPKLINTYEGTVFYYSENEDVATVDEMTGAVTLVGPGETMIFAYLDGEEPMDASYTLVVKLNPIDATDQGNHVDFRAVGNDGAYYATFSCTENVVFPDDIEVKTVTVSNSKMTLKDVEKSWYVKDGDYSTLSYGYYVPKGSGVLLRSTQETVPYYSVTEENPGKALDADNMMRGVDGDGLFEAEEGYRYYKLAYDNYEKKTDLGFYYGAPDGGAFAVRAGLAYLAVPESAMSQTSEAAPTHFIFGGDGDVTTIRDVEAEKSTKEPVIYNTAGQRVKAVGQPGVYIVNGRKVVVK